MVPRYPYRAGSASGISRFLWVKGRVTFSFAFVSVIELPLAEVVVVSSRERFLVVWGLLLGIVLSSFPLEGQVSDPNRKIFLEGVVTSFRHLCKWDHYDDGSFEGYDQLVFRITAPPKYRGKVLKVYYGSWKIPHGIVPLKVGVLCRFALKEWVLELSEIYWDALEFFRIVAWPPKTYIKTIR